MQTHLRYISISHKHASTAFRALFHLTEDAQKAFFEAALLAFEDIRGLMVLSTCNRTEVYFESPQTDSAAMVSFLTDHLSLTHRSAELRHLFCLADNTLSTAMHLLKVTSGMDSRIEGDAQIIDQVKTAFQKSVGMHKQGTLLERSMQSAFRVHKRIYNETDLRCGTVSFAYLSLKTIQQIFGKSNIASKRLLIVGAGDIAQEVLKYVSKFAFKEVHICNRTREKADFLAFKYNVTAASWELIESPAIRSFDAIITCAANSAQLLKANDFAQDEKGTVLIDLAMPANIAAPDATSSRVHYFDLDSLTSAIHSDKEKRENAMIAAQTLLFQELDRFKVWYCKIPVHQLLQQFRSELEDEIGAYLRKNYKTEISNDLANEISSALARKISRKPARTLNAARPHEQHDAYMKALHALF